MTRASVILLACALASTACQPEQGCADSECAAEDGSTDGGNDDDNQNCEPPEVPEDLALTPLPIKQFQFAWTVPQVGVAEYQLLERVHPDAAFVAKAVAIDTTISLTVPLHLRAHASYALRACNAWECADSAPIDVMGTLVDAIGYFKASNSDEYDVFGGNVVLSGDGRTLAVTAFYEDSAATGINGDQASNAAGDSGAVYVYVLDELDAWTQQAYIKASNTEAFDGFGRGLALNEDGTLLVVGAPGKADVAGAVYVFERSEMGEWTQQAYLEASNTEAEDGFGVRVASSNDGTTLAVAATGEDSSATGIDGNQADNAATAAGAVYVFGRDGMGEWTQQAYLKASNTGAEDGFGVSMRLSQNGSTLAVGAFGEASVDGNPTDDSALAAGAVYVFDRDGMGVWTQQAYLKAQNPGAYDLFGSDVGLSGDGTTLVVGAPGEASNAKGIDGDQTNDSAAGAGAVYVFTRDGLGPWTQRAYIKASNSSGAARFGDQLALTDDGNILAVGAQTEDGGGVGIDDPTLTTSPGSGAAYVFGRDELGVWTQSAYVKAPISGQNLLFGWEVALSGDGATLAVGARAESSNATGIGGDPTDDSLSEAGAVYLY
jgi:hypothetical protein